MAEALQLGLDVITTNYVGNSDFLAGSLAHPIAERIVPFEHEEYPTMRVWPGQTIMSIKKPNGCAN